MAIAAKPGTVRLDIPGPAYGPAARNGGHLRAAERHWQDAVAEAARVTLAGQPPWQGPVEVTLRLVFTPPKGWSKAQQRAKGPWKATAPRLENCARLVLSALEGVLFVDQAQVCRLELSKVYVNAGESMGLTLWAMEA